ncbi:uncharacterized protein ACNS7B_016367 isoform 1-T1 [Menidia menidia]
MWLNLSSTRTRHLQMTTDPFSHVQPALIGQLTDQNVKNPSLKLTSEQDIELPGCLTAQQEDGFFSTVPPFSVPSSIQGHCELVQNLGRCLLIQKCFSFISHYLPSQVQWDNVPRPSSLCPSEQQTAKKINLKPTVLKD